MTQNESILLDGKALAQNLKGKLAEPIGLFARRIGRVPGLAVILVGDDPASQVYVSSKKKQTVALGLRSFETTFPEDVTEERLLQEIERYNQKEDVDGILVQLPLPKHISETRIIEAIHPKKDVDGFHPYNVGRLAAGHPTLIPCTPLGSLMLLQTVQNDFSGMNAVVVGRSNIVGKPMAALLLQNNATVTIAHSRTPNLEEITRTADILVAAIGRPHFLGLEHIKKGAIVIDVGINRIAREGGATQLVGAGATHSVGAGATQLVGDVDFDAVAPHVRAITPVPGGVGPMTIACLLHNTVKAAFLRANLESSYF